MQSETFHIANPALYAAGFRDGRLGLYRGSLCEDSSYQLGFTAGNQFRLVTSPIPKTDPALAGWSEGSLTRDRI